jgi:hypothetical protein
MEVDLMKYTVTSVSVGGATTYIASGEIEVPQFALESWEESI